MATADRPWPPPPSPLALSRQTLFKLAESHFAEFKAGPHFETLLKSTGPKMITVSREKGADTKHVLDRTVIVGRSRDNDNADNYIHLESDHKVSRGG